MSALASAGHLGHLLVLACAGHLLIDLPIFMGPVVVLVGWLLAMTRRARRSERLEHGESTLAESTLTPAYGNEMAEKLMGVHA